MGFGMARKSRYGLGVPRGRGIHLGGRSAERPLDGRPKLGRLEGTRSGVSPDGAVAYAIRAAVLHYVCELDGGRAVPLPRIGRARRRRATLVEAADLDLDGETTIVLEREAKRQRVALEQLLEHALFVYLADVDSAYA